MKDPALPVPYQPPQWVQHAESHRPGADDALNWVGLVNSSWTPVISDQTLSGTSADVQFLAIPQTYRDLEIVYQARGDTAAVSTFIDLKFNNDGSAAYQRERVSGASNVASAGPVTGAAGTVLVVSSVPAASATANHAGSGRILIPNYAATTFYKETLAETGYFDGTDYNELASHGWWLSTAAITRIDVLPTAGNFIAGSRFTLLGKK